MEHISRDPRNWRLTETNLVRSYVFLLIPPIATETDVREWVNTQFPGTESVICDVICKAHLDDVIVRAWRTEFLDILDFVLSVN